MKDKRARLACIECDRDDKDEINESDLAACIKEGWTEIHQVQTHKESLKTYETPDDEPTGFSVLDWYTHLGTCPDCQEEKD